MKKISTITCKYLKIRPVILIVGFVNFLGIFCSCCSYISTDDGENFFNNIQDTYVDINDYKLEWFGTNDIDVLKRVKFDKLNKLFISYNLINKDENSSIFNYYGNLCSHLI